MESPGASPGAAPARTRGWLGWWGGRFRSLCFDLLVTVMVLEGVFVHHAVSALLAVCAVVVCAPALLLRRRFPWLAVAATVTVAFTGAVSWMACVAGYTAARGWGPGRRLWIASGLLSLAMIPGYYRALAGSADRLAYVVVIPLLAVAASVLLGLWVFQRGALLASLRDRAEQAERERDLLAERAVEAERRRIAREMHDVVAHRVSVISLQAGGLSVSAPDDRTAQIAEVIRRTSASALSELREALKVLRVHQPMDSGSGSPTLDGIATLVEDTVAAGANLQADLPDPLPEVSGAVGRAAYRVVQEALTNATKHAPHAAIRVTLNVAEDRLEVTVTNRRGAGSHTFAVPGSGYGLIGMRERVTLAGGTLHTGGTDDGGYRVRAVFPLGADEVAA
ncbi:sensor histidine kinase [Streptomyces sp. NPDC088560]|uniref:sensor histidine kinase n=1 Tax=Streptomyces sp. NPDC088560 TaxID=3365868 RepID=UPI00382D167D